MEKKCAIWKIFNYFNTIQTGNCVNLFIAKGASIGKGNACQSSVIERAGNKRDKSFQLY